MACVHATANLVSKNRGGGGGGREKRKRKRDTSGYIWCHTTVYAFLSCFIVYQTKEKDHEKLKSEKKAKK